MGTAMNSTVLLTKRAAHVESMKKLVDEKPDYDTEVFERMEAELQSLDKRIEHFKLLEAQAAEEKPLDAEESKLEQRSGQEFNLCRAIMRAHGGHGQDGLEGETQSMLRERSAANRDKHHETTILIPNQLFTRTATATTGSIGNALDVDTRQSEVITTLRDRTISGALGVRFINGMGSEKVRFPVQNANTTASWQTETGAVSNTDISFGQAIEFEPKRLSLMSSFSEQLLRQEGELNIQQMILENATQSIALAVDTQAFAATAVVTNAPEGLLRSITATDRTTSTNGLALKFGHLLDVIEGTENANAPGTRPGFTTNYAVLRKLKTMRKEASSTDSIFVYMNGQIDGYPSQITNLIPKTLTKGTGTNLSALIWSSDWTQFCICGFGNIGLVVDPYTSAQAGTIRMVWNHYVDMKVLRKEAFGTLTDIITV